MSDISPLFALDAEEFFDNREFSQAADLCKKGVGKFPDYALGYRILIKSLFENSDFDVALEYVEKAISVFPNDKFFSDFLLKIKNRIEEEKISEISESELPANETDNSEKSEQIDNTKEINYSNETIDDVIDESIENINYDYTEPESLNSNNFTLIPGFRVSSLEASNLDAQIKINEYSKLQKNQIPIAPLLEDKYSKIANDLKSIDFGSSKSSDSSKTMKKATVNNAISDTLASIYYKQGALEQALDAYKKLDATNPNIDYKKIISEIENKINSNN